MSRAVSLQAKFGVLLGLLCMTAALSVAAAVWALTLVRQEQHEPFESVTVVLAGLDALDADLAEQDEALRRPPSEESRRTFDAVGARAADRLARLEQRETYISRSGISTSHNLRRRFEAAQSAGDLWFDAPGEETRRLDATSQLADLSALIDRVESRIVADASLALDYAEGLHRKLLVVLSMALGSATVIAVIAFGLVRRWIVNPVAALRTAAAKIGAGDFSHRVPVAGADEIARLSAEINHMAGMVSAMQEERIQHERLAATGEMIRRLAHNIRNPLAGIRGLAEITRADVDGRPDLRDNQNRIIATVDRFERWLADLLAATSPFQFRPEPTAVHGFLRAVCVALEPMARTRGVRIDIDDHDAPEQASFDSRALEQAVVAIITNAIQASPERDGAAVGVRARRASTPGWWSIEVADQGPGVPPDLIRRIFHAHFTTKRDGSGIGLAVAQQVVRGHGGRIEVQTPDQGDAEIGSRKGPGALFRVLLPLDPPKTAPADPIALADIRAAWAERAPQQGRTPGPPSVDWRRWWRKFSPLKTKPTSDSRSVGV